MEQRAFFFIYISQLKKRVFTKGKLSHGKFL